MDIVFCLVVLISLSLGSFSNNLISFYIGTSPFDYKRSMCFCGKQRLKIWEIIPLLSFIIQKGRCSYCNDRIPFRFIVVEFIVMALGILNYLKYGLTLVFVFNYLIIFVLVLIGIIDFISFIIPNHLTFALILLLVLKIVFMQNHFEPITLLIPFLIPALLLALNINAKKKFIGMGDIKLLPFLLIIIGFPVNLFALWLSAAIGVFVYYTFHLFKSKLVPFGAFLSLSFIVCLLLEKEIYNVFTILITPSN